MYYLKKKKSVDSRYIIYILYCFIHKVDDIVLPATSYSSSFAIMAFLCITDIILLAPA